MAVIEAVMQSVRSIFTKPEPPSQAWNQDLASFVNRELDRRRKDRRPWELQWLLNMAFVDGKQLQEINTVTQNLEEVPRHYWWEEREVFNQIDPIIRVRHAKLSRIRHIIKVRPQSGERMDIMAAKVASKIVQFIYNECRIREQLSEQIMWSEICGDAFAKDVWDTGLGKVVGVLVDPETGLETEVYEGDIAASIHSPFEIYPDTPWIPSLPQQRSIIHAKAYHVDEAQERWGEKFDAEDVDTFTLQPARFGYGGMGYGAGMFRAVPAKVKNHVVVKEYWERPTREYPQGRLLVVVGNKTVHAGPLPYLVGPSNTPDFPFTKFPCLIRPGCFWDKSVVEILIPVQRRYNNLRNRVAEYLNRAALGQLDVEEGAYDLDDLEADGAAPGKILVRSRGSAPIRYVEYPPLPATFYREEATLMQEFITLSGVSEISKQSNAPPGVKSGVALSIALEQDDTRLSAVAANIEVGMIERGKRWLRLMKQFAELPRVGRYVGKDNVAEAFEFAKSDIRSDDVIVEGGSGLAESPAQRRQLVFDLVGAGILDPRNPAHKRKLLELIEFGHWELADDEQQRLQAARAERENMHLSMGRPAQVEFYDDHAIHADRHLQFILSAEFEELQTQNPEAAALFIRHLQEHATRQVAAAMPQGGGNNALPVARANEVLGGPPPATIQAVAGEIRGAQGVA